MIWWKNVDFGLLVILAILRDHFIVHIVTFLQVKKTGFSHIDLMLDGLPEFHIDHQNTFPIIRDFNKNILICSRYLLEDDIEVKGIGYSP